MMLQLNPLLLKWKKYEEEGDDEGDEGDDEGDEGDDDEEACEEEKETKTTILMSSSLIRVTRSTTNYQTSFKRT
eukprot:6498642-Ditylum_brightwellii.AAC.1